jgi:hypothetical protein
MRYDPHENVPVSIARSSVTVYGRRFDFAPPGDPNHVRERAEALRQAKQFGAERQAVMRKQADRELTMREEIMGELALPVEKSEPQIVSQPEGPPTHNFWAARAAELRRQADAIRPADEKAHLRRHLALAENLAAQWEAEHGENQPERPSVDENVVRLRKHAIECFERVNNNPDSTIAEIVARKRLLAIANAPDPEPGAYWNEVRAIAPETEPTTEPSPDSQSASDVPHPLYKYV